MMFQSWVLMVLDERDRVRAELLRVITKRPTPQEHKETKRR